MVLEARNAFGNRIFGEIFITGCWIIWTTINKVIFDNGSILISRWKQRFKEEMTLVCIKAKKIISDPLYIWLENYT